MKKYKLTDETIECSGRKLYRIEALIDFSDVKAGDKGGYVQSEGNLSQNGWCWIYDDAKIFGNAKVFGNAMVLGNAKVFENAKVFGDAMVYDNALIFDNANIHGYAKIHGNAEIYDNANIYGHSFVLGNAEILENAEVYDNAWIEGSAYVCGNAIVTSDRDFIVFKNWWSSGRYFTWTRSNNKWKVGCFYGTGEQLIKKAYADSEESGREYERVVRYVESILAEEKL